MRLTRHGVMLRTKRNGEGTFVLETAFWLGKEDTEWYPLPLSEAERIRLARELTAGLGYTVSQRRRSKAE